MLKPKQLLTTIYVNVCVKRVYARPHDRIRHLKKITCGH